MRIAPENKTLLYSALGLIGLLALFQVGQSISWSSPVALDNSQFAAMRSRLAREMIIRKRHARLVKEANGWESRFLPGPLREAELTLLKKTQEWAASSGLAYQSVRMVSGKESHERSAILIIQGKATFADVRRFLQQVENANFAVSATSIRLKKESEGKELCFELTLSAPLLGREEH